MPNVLTITCDASKMDAQLANAEKRVEAAKTKMQSGSGSNDTGGKTAQAMTNAGNAAKTAGGQFAAASNAVSALGAAAGVNIPPIGSFGSLIKSLASPVGLLTGAVVALSAMLMQRLQMAMRAQLDLAEDNLKNAQENARAHEELRNKTNQYLNTLQQLASKEAMSNAEKVKAIQTVRALTAAYGDLGIKVDSVTGRITGLDAATAKKLAADRSQEIRDLKNEQESLRQSRDSWQKYIDSWATLSPEAINNATDKRNAAIARIAEIDRKIKELKRSDPVKEYQDRRRAENADLEQEVARDRHRNIAAAEDAAANTPAKQLELWSRRLAEARKKLEDETHKLSYLELTATGTEEWRTHRAYAEKKAETERGKVLEIEARLSDLRKSAAESYFSGVFSGSGIRTNSLTARGGFSTGVRASDTEDRLQREILKCNQQVQRHAEAIARALQEN